MANFLEDGQLYGPMKTWSCPTNQALNLASLLSMLRAVEDGANAIPF
ncbi:hypothetical protein EYZ11_013208 [Aspergillus tanneri]|uniref:Uncharacterized protein n=1 Tax=Aspergillus tanneri TaxID=1220188 RepID=A0A4S3IYH6_9EURO|nr:hypothetical protein EYZ11_013208 [Aspergillus tanneri]